MTVHLGIDLGTTYSTVAAARNGRVELLSLGTRSAAVPSVVFVRDGGPPLVGEAAEARAQGDPSRYAREFKRRLGDPTPLILGGVPMGAERLSGFVLAYLVERATERLGEAPASIVLTHPASYTQYRLDLLGEAVHHAGLSDVRLLAEPRAAALHYATDNRVQEGETVAVYDFGGGTFDTALVRMRGGEFELIGEPQGIDRFGGIDIDLAVFDYVCDEAADLIGGLDAEEPVTRAMLARLRTDCRLAKERLSGDTETVVPVATPQGARDVVVTRRLLESMIRFRLADTVQALDRAVRTAGLNQSDVSRVLLVGGSSRIPLVRSLLAESFTRPVSVDADPESAIALGAAAAAARWAESAGAGAPAAAMFAAPVVPVVAPAPPADAPSESSAAAQAADPDADPGPADEPEAAAVERPAAPPAATIPPPARPVPEMAAPLMTAPPTPAPPGDVPPAPGAGRDEGEPPPKRRRGVIVAVVAAVVALLVAGVIVVLANRDPGSDDSDDGGTAAAIGFSDEVTMNPPDGFEFEPLPSTDFSPFASLALSAATDEVQIIRGAKVVDDDGSVPATVVLFDRANPDDALSSAAQQAVIDSVLSQQSVVPDSKVQHSAGQIQGTLFTNDDGRRGFIAPAEGGVVLVEGSAGDGAKFDDVITSLAKANDPDGSGTDTTDTTGDSTDTTTPSTETTPDTATDTTGGPTTTVAFDIDNVSFADLNTVEPTINPPAGFHFEPLTEGQIPILRTSAVLVGPTAASLHTVVGSPLYPDDGSPPPGGIIMFLGDGTAEFQQQVATALVTDGSAPSRFQVGPVVGTLFTRGDGTQGWVGPFHDSAILVSIDTVDPDHVALKAVLDGLGVANP